MVFRSKGGMIAALRISSMASSRFKVWSLKVELLELRVFAKKLKTSLSLESLSSKTFSASLNCF